MAHDNLLHISHLKCGVRIMCTEKAVKCLKNTPNLHPPRTTQVSNPNTHTHMNYRPPNYSQYTSHTYIGRIWGSKSLCMLINWEIHIILYILRWWFGSVLQSFARVWCYISDIVRVGAVYRYIEGFYIGTRWHDLQLLLRYTCFHPPFDDYITNGKRSRTLTEFAEFLNKNERIGVICCASSPVFMCHNNKIIRWINTLLFVRSSVINTSVNTPFSFIPIPSTSMCRCNGTRGLGCWSDIIVMPRNYCFRADNKLHFFTTMQFA